MADSTHNSASGGDFYDIINGNNGAAQRSVGISTKAFALNLATGLALFLLEVSGFFLLKSSEIGKRIYQPKTYLVEERLRVEVVPRSPWKWIYRIFNINGEELKAKCGLDGYFYVRFIRGMIIVFLPLMVLVVTTLLPINYHGGKSDNRFRVGNDYRQYNVTGLDTLAWQNVAPNHTRRYWAHLVCALIAIGWALYRIYREKLHFISVRQSYLLSPEHRLKASARTVLVTNIPSEYRSDEALQAFFDVFVDNDDRSKLHVWVNRDYKPLKALVMKRRSLRRALEKEELALLRSVNKDHRKHGADDEAVEKQPRPNSAALAETAADDMVKSPTKHAFGEIAAAFEADCREQQDVLSSSDPKTVTDSSVIIVEDKAGNWEAASLFQKLMHRGDQKSVPKTAWLRYQIALYTVRIDTISRSIDDENHFQRQNSAFIQFDRQMSANMACSLVSHHLPGRMTPRFLDVAPHEILWPNMGITSLGRFVRTCSALLLFVGMILLWGIPATFLGLLSQLATLRESTDWLAWLKSWPSYLISVISGPVVAILLALLVQLVVPALCRKLAVLVGAPTRSKREVITQGFYFTFLFVELVLVTSVSSGITAVVPAILSNPQSIPTTLANNLPKASNYFFNYLIIQGLAFSGSVLFQYLRLLYISTIYPWVTQTPRAEAWLQTTIPHQMWGNVYPLITNFAVIGLIYSIIAPLMLVFISGTFSILWIAYRHNYYYVQRVKVDTHGMLFENALSQLFAGIYVLEIVLIGLFFLVRNSNDNVACTSQAIIMIVALVLTAAYHYLLEQYLQPLYELLPVSLEDPAADAEQRRFLEIKDDAEDEEGNDARPSGSTELQRASTSFEQPEVSGALDGPAEKPIKGGASGLEQTKNTSNSAANARKTLSRLRKRVGKKVANAERLAVHSHRTGTSRRLEVADQIGAAIAAYPDELSDLSPRERNAIYKVAYQDPVTREPAPIIWIPEDDAGLSAKIIARTKKYGRYLQYSNEGAYLTKKNKVEVMRPAPDTKEDWLLEWVL